MDSLITVKATKEDTFSYELYNFGGAFNNVEEAIIKTLQSYPQDDPVALLDLSINQEFISSYTHSKQFLDNVCSVEKNGNLNKVQSII